MIIDSTGPKIDLKDIINIEARLGATLPDSYRNFLLHHNGGTPTPDTVDISGLPNTPTDVQVFFGIGRAVESSNLSWNLDLIKERHAITSALPIACDSGGNIFFLRIQPDATDEVIYCDFDAQDCTIYDVAPSFNEFIAKLRPLEY